MGIVEKEFDLMIRLWMSGSNTKSKIIQDQVLAVTSTQQQNFALFDFCSFVLCVAVKKVKIQMWKSSEYFQEWSENSRRAIRELHKDSEI